VIDLNRPVPFEIYRWVDDLEVCEVKTVTKVEQGEFFSGAWCGKYAEKLWMNSMMLKPWHDTEQAAIENWREHAQREIAANLKDIQRLNEQIASTRRAIVRASEKLNGLR
jgi:hypothetical protein